MTTFLQFRSRFPLETTDTLTEYINSEALLKSIATSKHRLGILLCDSVFSKQFQQNLTRYELQGFSLLPEAP